jgi:2-amino-4-hydroxy-6-hydroxymethyldihydropteridine diphosphokinase
VEQTEPALDTLAAVPPMTATVYLSLGSNLGNREKNLRDAIAALPTAGLRVTQVSSFYETEPVDYLDQPWFLNCVVEGQTELEPLTLLHALRSIESRLGSKKQFAKGPRLLDIDILLFADRTIDAPELKIPHPRMTQRRFVLAPLAELAPQLRHPAWNGNVAELLAQVNDRSEVRRLEPTE